MLHSHLHTGRLGFKFVKARNQAYIYPFSRKFILQPNTLYYGDNLSILRDYIPDESVDLIYLDLPSTINPTYIEGERQFFG